MREHCDQKGMKQGGQQNCYKGKKGCGRRGALAEATGEWGCNRKGACRRQTAEQTPAAELTE